MIIYLIVIALLFLLVFYMLGRSILSLFKVELTHMSFLVGYLFTLLIFHLLSFFFISNHYPFSFFKGLFPFFLSLILFLSILYPKQKRGRLDPLVLVGILLFSVYYFSLAIDVNSYYLPLIKQNITSQAVFKFNPSNGHVGNIHLFNSYDLWVSLCADFFRVDSTTFTVLVIGYVNLFIILYTNFEFCQMITKSRRQALKSFLLFLLLFFVCNTRQFSLFHPLNAYDFIYNIYSGVSIYIYAILIFQFALYFNFHKKNIPLIFLVNMGVISFTTIALYTQFIFNISMLFLLLYLKQIKSLKNFTSLFLVTILPTLLHSYFFLLQDTTNVTINVRVLFLILVTILSLVLIMIALFIKPNLHLYFYKTVFYVTYIVLFISLIGGFIYLLINKSIQINFSDLSFLQDAYTLEKAQIIVFYLIALYSLYRLTKAKDINNKLIFLFLPLVLFLFFVNPFVSIVASKVLAIPFNYFFYLMPLAYSIIFVFFRSRNLLMKTVILLAIFLIPKTIFSDIPYLFKTDKEFFTRLDKDVLQVGQSLGNEEVMVLGDELIIKEIRSANSHAKLIIDDHALRYHLVSANLEKLYLMISDRSPYDEVVFLSLIDQYQINRVIVNKQLVINQYLTHIAKNKIVLDYYVIYSF